MTYTILARCERGHQSTYTIIGEPIEAVEVLAGLIDGSVFPIPPGDGSVIGRCAWHGCGARFTCAVMPA